jgi:hypothetical protein
MKSRIVLSVMIFVLVQIGCKRKAPPTNVSAVADGGAAKTPSIAEIKRRVENRALALLVDWRKLAVLLRDRLSGWRAAGIANGRSQGMGDIQVSSATRTYEKNGIRAQVKIVDTLQSRGLVTGFELMRSAPVNSPQVQRRIAQIQGQPALEERSQGSGRSRIFALVGDRFLVETHVSGLPDAKSVFELVGALDLKRLAVLRGEGR